MLLALAAAACDPASTLRNQPPVVRMALEAGPMPSAPVAAGVTVARFVAAVPAFEGAVSCDAHTWRGERLVMLRYDAPGGRRRIVTLRYAAGGALAGYSDVRWDPAGEAARPMTTVSLVFGPGRRGSATNFNAGPGATPGRVAGTAAEMLDLPNLGTPRRMIEAVRARCMPAAPAA
jgi:hypothetical protein